MPTLSSYRNGSTMGVSGGNPNPPKRGRVTGWSAGAVRRHTAWLYSIDAPALDGHGHALTLTMRDTPPTGEDWQRLRKAWEDSVRRQPGFRRLHWVVEWQRRGTPHLHCALYFDEPGHLPPSLALGAWLSRAGVYGARLQAQHLDEIDGPLGWLQYLSKHASRGVKHYQRQGRPDGWESTGRLWGKSGDWPADVPMRYDLDMPAYHRYRRLVRSWRVAAVRLELDRATDPKTRAKCLRRLSLARRMLSSADPRLSAVRGVSDWVPESTSAAFVALLASEGAGVRQVHDGE